MPDEPTESVLRRIAAASVPPPPLTPARALRLAVTRAAERSIGLRLAVQDITEEEAGLDEHLAELGEGLMLLVLRQEGEAVGLVALDAEARAAAIEAQALGRVSTAPAEPREPTGADAALARPLLAMFLAEVEAAAAGTALEGWLRAPVLGERVPSAREAPLLLPDGRYRLVRLRLDLGASGRSGLLLLLARLPAPAGPVGPEAEAALTFAAQVLRAETGVEAVLHRLRLSLGEAEGLTLGQVLPLPGVTVTSVRLESGGTALGLGRLGQVAGMRAVRIEAPLAPILSPISALRETDPAGPALLPGDAPRSQPEAEGPQRERAPVAAGPDGAGEPNGPDADRPALAVPP